MIERTNKEDVMRFTKKMEGRPVDFKACNSEGERIINGRVRSVRNNVAVIEYWLPERWNEEPFVTYIEPKDNRIVAAY